MLLAAVARLRRVARPRFEPVARCGGGRVVLGRVLLGRRRPVMLGWSVRCGAREVHALRGGHGPVLLADDGAQVVLRDGRGGRVRVRARDCAVEGLGRALPEGAVR